MCLDQGGHAPTCDQGVLVPGTGWARPHMLLMTVAGLNFQVVWILSIPPNLISVHINGKENVHR